MGKRICNSKYLKSNNHFSWLKMQGLQFQHAFNIPVVQKTLDS